MFVVREKLRIGARQFNVSGYAPWKYFLHALAGNECMCLLCGNHWVLLGAY